MIKIAVSSSYAVGPFDSNTELQAPIREGEKPDIPLDTKDPTYNAWQKLRDFSKDPKREPGPINIQKYDFGFSWFGIPTFFHLPVALTPEDLKAGKVDVYGKGNVGVIHFDAHYDASKYAVSCEFGYVWLSTQ